MEESKSYGFGRIYIYGWSFFIINIIYKVPTVMKYKGIVKLWFPGKANN